MHEPAGPRTRGPAPPRTDAAEHGSPDADEAASTAARRRFREGSVDVHEPDARIAPLLRPDELVLAVRGDAALDRRQPCPPHAPDLHGALYLTSDRIVHVGRRPIVVELDDIEDSVVAAGRLLLALRDGNGIAIDTDGPLLLRVQIAAARAARAQRGVPSARVSAPRGSVEPPPIGS